MISAVLVVAGCERGHAGARLSVVPNEAIALAAVVVASSSVRAVNVAEVSGRSHLRRVLCSNSHAVRLVGGSSRVVPRRAVAQGAIPTEPLRQLPVPAGQPHFPRRVTNAPEDHLRVPRLLSVGTVVSGGAGERKRVKHRRQPPHVQALTVPRAGVRAQHSLARVSSEAIEAGARSGGAVAKAHVGALGVGVSHGRGGRDVAPRFPDGAGS